jgi:cell division protein FtsA
MVVVGEVLPGGDLKLAGLGVAPSNGLKRGVVVNIDATVNSIQQALKEAELMADCKITRVYTGITGSHIRGLNSSGMVAVKDKEVTAIDVARVIETAKAINISSDQRLLLVAPQEFVIDGQDVKRARRHERHAPGRPRCISSPARRAPPRTSSNAFAAAAWKWTN